MHGRLCKISAWLLAAAVWGAGVPARGEDGRVSSSYYEPDPYYSTAGDRYGAPAAPPTDRTDLVSSNLGGSEADLNARLVEVEKALKKLDDKAKEDKKKAAGKMSVTPSGRIQFDAAGFGQDAVDKARWNEQNGVELRRARIALSGDGFNVIKYKIEWDFAGKDRSRAKDIYIAITDLPLLQNIQIGHFKEPYSLDELIGSNYMTFMERNVASEVMAPKRHIGVMAFGATESENATYAIGAFAEHNDDGAAVQNDNSGASATMRGTWLPWYDEATEGRGLLHVGLAYSHRTPFRDQFTIKYRPECHLAHENVLLLDDVVNRELIGTELAFVYGPFSFQTEYYVNFIDRSDHADCKTQGAYAYVSYFLTGEHRPYDRKKGVFSRVKPYENFFRVRDENCTVYTGRGAWELKYRYSWFDGYDHDLLGYDYVGDHTVGVNWYLTPYTRMMLEYVHSAINRNQGAGAGDLNIVQMRAQIDF